MNSILIKQITVCWRRSSTEASGEPPAPWSRDVAVRSSVPRRRVRCQYRSIPDEVSCVSAPRSDELRSASQRTDDSHLPASTRGPRAAMAPGRSSSAVLVLCVILWPCVFGKFDPLCEDENCRLPAERV